MNTPIRVLLIDDHQLVRDSLRDRLEHESDIQVVGMANSGDEALRLTLEVEPHVVLMDIDMPGIVAFDAAKEIKRMRPAVHVVFLSAFFNDRYIESALGAQATGYLTKDQAPNEVVEAIRRAASGIATFSSKVQKRLVIDAQNGVRLGEGGTTRVSSLTPRETEILRYLARGMSKKEIAATLKRSTSTVERHTENLMNKLDIHDRVELARFAIREGLSEA